MPQSHWQSPTSSCYGSVVSLSILFTYLVLVSVLVLFCADFFYSGVIQCFAAIVNHLIPFEFYICWLLWWLVHAFCGRWCCGYVYPHKRRHSRWKLSQELKKANTCYILCKVHMCGNGQSENTSISKLSQEFVYYLFCVWLGRWMQIH